MNHGHGAISVLTDVRLMHFCCSFWSCSVQQRAQGAHQPVLRGEHVHGAALAAADAGVLAVQLRHDVLGGHALAQRVHVVSVGAADVVALPQVADDSRGHRLLPAVQVHEPCARGPGPQVEHRLRIRQPDPGTRKVHHARR